ncbi:MAG: hypothetical protein P1V97_32960 [Planctomycetota bacterium]|nr:hypothetical protein [Planctomycetota bacterium]
MRQTPILTLGILIFSSQFCFGQDKTPRGKEAGQSARKYSFEISIDARNQGSWLRFIKQQKGLSVVRTKKGFVKVDLDQKVVTKVEKSSEDLGAKFDSSAYLRLPKIPAVKALYSFLERSGHGPKKEMEGMLFFPKSQFRKFEKLVEAACYKYFIPTKKVTKVVFNYRKTKLRVAEIEYREQGKAQITKLR